MSEVRITHLPDPAKPEAPQGIIIIEVDGARTPLPHKGQDKIIKANGIKWQVHAEPTKKNENL